MLLRSMENTVIKVPEAGAENNLLVNNNSGQLRGGDELAACASTDKHFILYIKYYNAPNRLIMR